MAAYHNTVAGQGGRQVEKYNKVAAAQDDAVLTILRLAYPASLSPSQVWDIYQKTGKTCPITSIRRALTNLTKAGFCYKTDVLREGEYGRKEHTWKIILEPLPATGTQLSFF